jgi:2-C-methyl-D-erythritol 4-phosphate cytidylyltransferase
MSTWTIVLAAGAGRRFDPVRRKQYELIGTRRVVDLSLEHARSVSDGVVVVVGHEFVPEADAPADVVVMGGERRSDSVRCGLDVIPDDCDVIVVHDAARPLAQPALFEAVVAAVRGGADGAIPGVAITDTLKRVDGRRVMGTVDRSLLVAVQTPQAFGAEILRQAHSHGADATDDAALVEALGGSVVVVPGDPDNLKITTQTDLTVARLRLV